VALQVLDRSPLGVPSTQNTKGEAVPRRPTSFTLTPMYDVLSVQTAVDRGQLNLRSLRLAMSAGTNSHYRVGEVLGRHFVQTAKAAGLRPTLIEKAITDIQEKAERAPDVALLNDFAEEIHGNIRCAIASQLDRLDTAFAELG
jgi:serine/threonine-protein kinase HipA